MDVIDFDRSRSVEIKDKLLSTIKSIRDRSNRNAKASELDVLELQTDNLFNLCNSLFLIIEQNSTNAKSNEKLDKILKAIENPTQKAPFSSLFDKKLPNKAEAIKADQKDIKQTVILSPKDDTNIKPEALEMMLKTQIHTHKTNAKIIKINRNRKNVRILCDNIDEANKLTSQLTSDENIFNKANIFISKKRNPSIVIKNIDGSYDDTNLIKDLQNYNDLLSKNNDDYSILFNINKSYGCKDIVLRVSPENYQTIKKMDFKVFIPGQRCNVQNKILFTQCQNCFFFGHKTKECKRPTICYTCGLVKKKNQDGSVTHTCSGMINCVNCDHYNANSKNKDFRNTEHYPNRVGCPHYDINIERIINNTQYQPL